MNDPRKIPQEQLDKMRADMAASTGISLYKRYSEKQTAAFNGIDYSTQKRRRKAGGIVHVLHEGGAVQYLGVMIIDNQLFGSAACLLWGGSPPDLNGGEANTMNENTGSETSGSPNVQGQKPGIELGTTKGPSKPAALASALRTLR